MDRSCDAAEDEDEPASARRREPSSGWKEQEQAEMAVAVS